MYNLHIFIKRGTNILKKKIMSILVCTVIVLSICGCHKNITTVTRNETEPVTEEETTMPDPVDWSKYAAHENADFYFPDSLTQLDGMYMDSACFYDDDNLMLVYTAKDYTEIEAYIFSLDYGTMTECAQADYEPEDPDMGLAFTICSTEPLVLYEIMDEKLLFFQEEELSMSMDVAIDDNNGIIEGMDGLIYIDSEADTLNWIGKDGKGQKVINERMETSAASVRTAKYITEDDKYLIAYGVNKISQTESTYVVSLDTGDIVNEIDGKINISEHKDDFLTFNMDEESFTIHDRKKTDISSVTSGTYNPGGYLCYGYAEDEAVFSFETTDKGMKINSYNPVNMKAEKTAEIDPMQFQDKSSADDMQVVTFDFVFSNAYSKARNMMLIYIRNNYSLHILLWDMDKAENSTAAIEVNQYEDTAEYASGHLTDYGELTSKIEEIYEKYGVNVYIGEDVPTDYGDYIVDKKTDYSTMESNLNIVNTALEKYPEHFFDFLKKDRYLSGLCIYLVGSIYSNSDTSISNAGGFASKNNDYATIIIDSNLYDDNMTTVAHEVSHVIYDRVVEIKNINDKAAFEYEDWMKYNPEGFEYYGSYLDEDGNGYDSVGDISNTGTDYYNNGDLSSVYFIDTYSKTFVTEDLARIMEYSMNLDIAPEYIKSEHLKAKMSYYFKAIREVWDTTGWPEVTYWEKAAQ